MFARSDRDFDEELSTHIALLTERYIRQGMTPEEAAYAAQRQFGGVTQTKQLRRESRAWFPLENFLRDVRQAVRTLRKSPGFTATAMAALALGIGANVAIFSVVSTVFLKPLNAPEPERLVRFLNRNQFTSWETSSFPQFNFWRQQTTAFETIAAHRLDVLNLTGDSPEQIPVARVSAGFLEMFGAPVISGRGFNAEEDRPGSAHVVLLSYGLWTRRFGGDPHAVGTAIELGNDRYTIIGIVARNFDSEQFDVLPEAWIPFQIDPNTTEMGSFCTVTGRLKKTATVAAANSELEALTKEYYGMLTRPITATFAVKPLEEAMVRNAVSPLMLLTGAVACVLLIACANVANLLLARAAGRRREIAIRTAVGASRGRIVRQLLTESLVLSVSAGIAGLALGSAGIRLLLRWYPASLATPSSGNAISLPRVGESGSAIAMDWRVVAFTVLISIGAGILFGILPAFQTSRAEDLKRTRTRSVFVAAEMALAVILLVGSGLFLRSYAALRSVNPGFDSSHVITAQMSLSATRFEKTAEMARLVKDGAERIRELPGVADAGAACCIPLETVWQLPLEIVGRQRTQAQAPFAGWTFISPEYFDVFKIPVLKGRAFTERDDSSAPAVVIINEALARRFWRDSDPLGGSLRIGRGIRPEYDTDTVRRIVGVVGNVRDISLNAPPRPAMYVPIAQMPDAINSINLRLLPLAWFVRARADTRALRVSIEQELQHASGGLPITRFRTMDEVEGQSAARTHFEMLLMAIFGAAALVLAAIGIYGLIAYSVGQRTKEIGIRMALGARANTVRNQMMLEGGRAALCGAAVGLVAALGLTRLVTAFLFGVRPWDPVSFLAAPLILGLVAFAAVWIPARRVARVDPASALRCE